MTGRGGLTAGWPGACRRASGEWPARGPSPCTYRHPRAAGLARDRGPARGYQDFREKLTAREPGPDPPSDRIFIHRHA
jgi:hypothetical protein